MVWKRANYSACTGYGKLEKSLNLYGACFHLLKVHGIFILYQVVRQNMKFGTKVLWNFVSGKLCKGLDPLKKILCLKLEYSLTYSELQIVGAPAPVTHNFSKWRVTVKVYAPGWRVIKIKKLTDELPSACTTKPHHAIEIFTNGVPKTAPNNSIAARAKHSWQWRVNFCCLA